VTEGNGSATRLAGALPSFLLGSYPASATPSKDKKVACHFSPAPPPSPSPPLAAHYLFLSKMPINVKSNCITFM